MRIDPSQVAATMNQADLASAAKPSLPKHISQPHPSAEEAKSAAPAAPAPTQVSVSVDSDHNIIYQFLDARTGQVVQQVPPEQVLQVMRSIADLLRESEQKIEFHI